MPALNKPKWEQFALLVATGETLTAAYGAVYNAKGRTAEVNGCKLLRNPKVSLRISELRQDYQRHCAEQAKERFLTVDKVRAYLAAVVRTPIGEVDEKSPLCQSAEFTVAENGTKRVKYRMPDKLKAIELDLRITGELAGDRKTAKVDMQKVYEFIAKQITYGPKVKTADGREFTPVKRFGSLELTLDEKTENEL